MHPAVYQVQKDSARIFRSLDINATIKLPRRNYYFTFHFSLMVRWNYSFLANFNFYCSVFAPNVCRCVRLLLCRKDRRKPARISILRMRWSAEEQFIDATVSNKNDHEGDRQYAPVTYNYLKQPAGWRIQSAFLGKCAMSSSDDNDCLLQIRRQLIGRLLSYPFVALCTISSWSLSRIYSTPYFCLEEDNI